MLAWDFESDFHLIFGEHLILSSCYYERVIVFLLVFKYLFEFYAKIVV